MKKKISLLVLITAAVWLIYWKLTAGRSAHTNSSADQARKELPVTNSNAGNSAVQIENSNDISARAQKFVQNVRNDPSYPWKQPISFWGKVIDEDGSPVPGADIRFVWTDLSPRGTSESKTVTDSLGRFSLLNKQGKRLTVYVSKPEYYNYPGTENRSFEYASTADHFFPDETKPVEFRMKKKQAADPLQVSMLAREFTVITNHLGIDLKSGKWVPANVADLVISFQRDQTNNFRRANWEVTLNVPKGGIQESTKELQFEAPVEGYYPEFTFSVKAEDPAYASKIDKTFFVRLDTGPTYGRITALLSGVWRDRSAAHLKIWFNTNGTRNLEFDPNRQDLPPLWH